MNKNLTQIIKVLLKPILLLRKLYWRLFRPTTVGVRAIVLNDKRQVLLVKHTYTNDWYLPGGKVDKNESLIVAVKRELKEEIGITQIEDIEQFYTYSNFFEYKSDYITVFIVQNFNSKNRIHFEIEEFGYYGFEEIPINISKGTKRRLKEFFEGVVKEDLW
ncbi:MAG: NUDIX domain-containing protein [Chitinophagales bacterium]